MIRVLPRVSPSIARTSSWDYLFKLPNEGEKLIENRTCLFSFNTNTAPTAPHNKPVAYVHPSDGIQGCLLPCRGKADCTHTRRPMQVCYGTALTDSPFDKTVTSKEH